MVRREQEHWGLVLALTATAPSAACLGKGPQELQGSVKVGTDPHLAPKVLGKHSPWICASPGCQWNRLLSGPSGLVNCHSDSGQGLSEAGVGTGWKWRQFVLMIPNAWIKCN